MFFSATFKERKMFAGTGHQKCFKKTLINVGEEINKRIEFLVTTQLF